MDQNLPKVVGSPPPNMTREQVERILREAEAAGQGVLWPDWWLWPEYRNPQTPRRSFWQRLFG